MSKQIKTSELQGAALDWAVAKCEGVIKGDALDIGFILEGGYTPSTDWAQGGPIIERERINTWNEGYDWEASRFGEHIVWGNTPLIAAMRCYVASKLGDTVGIPKALAA